MQNSFVPQFMLDDEKVRMETRIKQAKNSNINYTLSPIKKESTNKKKKLRLRNNFLSTIIDENGQSELAEATADV